MMVTYIYAQLYVVKQIQVLRLLKMMSVKFLSMIFICWALVKLGFVKRLLNGEHYKRVDVRSCEKKNSKTKTLFSI